MTVAATTSTRSGLRLAIPGQHGAWAFLGVPLLLGFAVVGWSAPAALFALAWVLAFPASYYLGRAVVIRWRRGNWSRLARRELHDAVPWVVLAGVAGLILLVLRPWLLWVGAVLGVLWGASLWLTRTGHERGASNDLLLVAQASLAVPLMWGIATDTADLGIGTPAAADAWLAAFVCLMFFTGSVLHVKSLIRQADDRRWAIASRVFAVLSLAMGLISPWLILPFGAAAVRSFAVRAGSRPAVIGAVEIVVSVLIVVGGALALA
ncbi:MAG: YwiC-like family protein [Candidatus Nanopelagicales bacterium]